MRWKGYSSLLRRKLYALAKVDIHWLGQLCCASILQDHKGAYPSSPLLALTSWLRPISASAKRLGPGVQLSLAVLLLHGEDSWSSVG
jgi:hypothetical protein